MRIQCPYCGERSLDEFVFQGDADVVRADGGLAASLDDVVAFAYERKNVAGAQNELWQHIAGCRAWLVVTRDTRTHAISSTAFARDAALAKRASSDGDGA